jgi:polysaccharide biosynthesis transport protein
MNDPLAKLGSQSNGPNVRNLLAVLRKRKWLILGISLTVPLLVGFLVSKRPKIYQASTSIIIDTSVPQYLGQGFKDVVEGETNWWSSRESLETELRILRSHSQALAVAAALCDKTFAGGPALHFIISAHKCGEPAAYEEAAPMLQGMLKVEPVRDSRVVYLTVQTRDPDFAALVANTAASIYVTRNLERRLAHTEGAAHWLEDEYGGLMSQVLAAEQALVEFKKRNNIVAVSIADDQNDLSNRRKALSQQLNDIEVKLIVLRAQREQIANARTTDSFTDLGPVLVDNPILQKLKEQYFEQSARLSEMQGKYLEKHPMVVAQETRLEVIKKDLVREAELARKQVELQYQQLTKQASELRSAVNTATRDQLMLESRASEYNKLRRELERLQKLSETVGGRGQETSLVTNLKTNNVRILDPARGSNRPVAPDVPRAIAVAAIIGLLLALGLATALEALDSTVKTQEDVEKTVGVTFLGLIPRVELEKTPEAAPNGAAVRGSPRDTYVYLNPNSAVAECCRAIRTNLLFMTPDAPAQTLLVTSAGPQEGKTTVAINMAITLAQSGLRVLIVDTDMRRPRVHKALGLTSTADGLSKAIVGECEVLDVIRESSIPNLWVLPCGACPPNPAELLHAERFRRIVEVIAGSFDRVIFDSPPVGLVTDAAILARITHGTILVAKAGRTSRDALTRARAQVSSDNSVNILGCILNDLDLSKQKQYGYYYYYRYGYYYRSDEAAAAGVQGGTGVPS